MPARDPNVEFFLRTVEERYEIFKSSFSSLVSALCSENIQEKKKAAEDAQSASDSLLSIISKSDHPGWLTQFKSDLHVYIQSTNRSGSSNRLMKSMLKLHPQMESHRWAFDRTSVLKPVQFEEIFKEVYTNSKGPDLFEKLLASLQSIVDSGEVDSLKAIEALNKLIATIKANMRGTYFQAVGTTHFANSVLRNYLWKLLKKVPGIGDLLEAVSETLEEMDGEMSEIHSKVKAQLKSHSMGNFEALEYQGHDSFKLSNPDEENP